MPDEQLSGRRVVVHVSGSVAAFKACELVGLLRRRGAEVRVAMTAAGARFVTPMTFQSLSGNPVATSLWDEEAGAAAEGALHGMAHLGLGAWAELQIAAPASADLIARLAIGLADDAVTATALATGAPLLVAPAMEAAMWHHPATREHVETLVRRGATLVGPESGRLASGHEGEGRMAEPEAIVEAAARLLGAAAGEPSDGDPSSRAWLRGRRVVVTAGGTREPIDPVRFLGNHSSGKMGAALVAEALRLGARVTLVTAAPPPRPQPNLEVVEAQTAQAMLDAVRAALPGAAVLVMAAAVADYRPATASASKLKKRAGSGLTLELVPTVDILTSLRDDPSRNGTALVGFAAETGDLLDNARGKLAAKGLDAIVANDVAAPGVGMGADENAVTILTRDGRRVDVPRSPKSVVARRVFEVIREVVGGA